MGLGNFIKKKATSYAVGRTDDIPTKGQTISSITSKIVNNISKQSNNVAKQFVDIVDSSFKTIAEKSNETISIMKDGPIEEQQEVVHATNTTETDFSETPKYHIVVNKERKGPLTKTQLLELISSGAINKDTFVFFKGLQGWTPIDQIDELSDLF